jgi:hypothetical protein
MSVISVALTPDNKGELELTLTHIISATKPR